MAAAGFTVIDEVQSAPALFPVLKREVDRHPVPGRGYHEDEIGIVFSGLPPGEKLYKELLADADDTLPSKHERRIAKLNKQSDRAVLLSLREKLASSSAVASEEQVKRWRREVVVEYRGAS